MKIDSRAAKSVGGVTIPTAHRPSHRDKLLKTFTRHVAQFGYDGTSFGAIAADLNLSKGTIVHHFGTKIQMMKELQESYLIACHECARAMFTELTTAPQRLAGVIYALTLNHEIDPYANRAYQREVARFDAAPEMERARELARQYRAMVADVVTDGIATGEFRPINTQLVVLQLYGAIMSVWTWYRPDRSIPIEVVASSFVDVLLGGILTDRTDLGSIAAPDGEIVDVVRRCLRPQVVPLP